MHQFWTRAQLSQRVIQGCVGESCKSQTNMQYQTGLFISPAWETHRMSWILPVSAVIQVSRSFLLSSGSSPTSGSWTSKTWTSPTSPQTSGKMVLQSHTHTQLVSAWITTRLHFNKTCSIIEQYYLTWIAYMQLLERSSHKKNIKMCTVAFTFWSNSMIFTKMLNRVIISN